MSDYPMLISNKLHSFRNFEPQRYEKSSAEASASLIMPRRSIYDEVKDTIKPNAMQIYLLFAEAKYPPGVSQRYEPAAASPAARFQKERNEGFFMVRS